MTGIPELIAEALTVSALVNQLKGQVERQFAKVWVAGEVSNFTRAASGHWYFTLKDAGAQIKAAVRAEQELTVSVGVAATKLVAKIASDLRKPDGLVVVPPGQEAAFLAPLPIRRLWGVGPKMEEELAKLGVATRTEAVAVARRDGLA